MNGYEIANGISQRLKDVYGENLAPSLIYAQLSHETGGFTSELATKHHNYGGVTQTTPNGLAQPDGSNYYMNFDSDESFMDYMAGYLYKYKEDGLFDAYDARSYATALKHGGYFGDDVENYAAGMQNAIGTASLGEFIEGAYEGSNPTAPVVEQEEPEEADFFDKMQDTMFDSALWGSFRTAAAKKDLPDEEGYKLTQEDIDRVQKELGDYTATLWVCQNANSPAQLERLIRMKKEDLERRKRVEESSMGLSTAGTLLGLFLDPLNYVPILGATGKLGSAARYAKLAAGASVGNLVDRGLAQAATGYRQDYPMAALMGAVGGAGIPMALDLLGKGFSKATKAVGEQLYGEATNIIIDAERLAKGEKLSVERTSSKEFIDSLTQVHDKDFVKAIKDAGVAGQIRPKHNVFVVSKENAKKIVEGRGWEFDDNAKGFFDDETGVTVLIKENLSGSEDIRKTLLHERGAHGLKYVLSPNDYAKVLAELRFRINNNPSPAIERAIKRAGGNADAEEVLGYLAEEMKPSNPLMRNIRKAMDKGLNALGVKGRLSDDDFIDILTKGAKHYADGQNGYRVLKDGSCEYKGIHYSTKNLFNPANLTRAAWFEHAKKKVKETAETLSKRTALYATPYSVCSTSKSKTLKELAGKLVTSPYMERLNGGIPAEVYKDNMRFHAEHMINNYMKVRDEALVRLQTLSADAKYDYNEAVIRAYNAKNAGNTAATVGHNFPPEVMKGVAEIEKLREYLKELLTDPSKYLGEGYGLLPHDWYNHSDEFFRWIDEGKHAKLLVDFQNKEDMAKFLYKYCYKFGKKDVVRKQIEDEMTAAWRKECEKAKAKGKPLPEAPKLSEDEFLQEYDKRARECAMGWTDLGASETEKTANFNMTKIGSLDCLNYRFPLDTSGQMEIKGNMFSFDDNLRSYDIDSFLNPLVNRLTGEVSLTTVFPKDAQTIFANPLGFVKNVDYNLQGMRSVIDAELDDLVQRRQITKDQKTNDLRAFDFMCDKLRSMPVAEHPHTLLDAAARTLNSYAYARNSGNMVFNQLGEISGTLAYAGYNALFDVMPGLGKIVTEARMGKGSVEMLEDARLATFGDEGYRYIFGNAGDSSSRIYRDILNDTRTAKALDKVAGFANLTSNLISKVTGFQKLTETMIQSAQKQTMIDLAKWVNGKEFPSYRNPFSKNKLEAIGLKYKNSAADFREALKPYIVLDKEGNLVDFNIKALRQNDPELYMQYYMLMTNQVKRCITMPSIGSTNMLKEANPFWRVFFMFKDFTMRATHTQTLRVAHNRETDDLLATMFSMATNLAVVTGLAYARSKFVYNRKNEAEHERYMKEYMSPKSLIYIAGLRGSVTGSSFSHYADIAEAAGLSPVPSIRTTTNRYKRDKNSNEIVGEYLTQLPAIKTGTDLLKAPMQLTKVLPGERYTRKDFDDLLQLLPGQNFILMLRLRDELADAANLPKR